MNNEILSKTKPIDCKIKIKYFYPSRFHDLINNGKFLRRENIFVDEEMPIFDKNMNENEIATLESKVMQVLILWFSNYGEITESVY